MKRTIEIRWYLFLLICILATTSAFAQPYFVEPVTCIAANPEISVTDYKIVANNNTITAVEVLGDLELIGVSQALPAAGDIAVTVRSKNKGRDERDDCDGYLKKKKSAAFGFGKAVIRVYYNSKKCKSFIDQEIFKIFEEAPPINGPQCIEPGETVTYNVCAILTVNLNDNIGIDEYFWSDGRREFPPGLAEPYYSADHSAITFKVTDEWAGGRLYCRFGRCNKNLSFIDIGVKTAAPSSVLLNETPVYNGQVSCIPASQNTISLSATGTAGGAYTYSWSTNNNSWGFGAAGNPTAITTSGEPVELNINESAGEVYLKTTGGCGTITQTFIIHRSLGTPLLIRRTDTISCLQQGNPVIFSVSNASGTANTGNLSCSWLLPSGWSIIGNSSAAVITAIAGAAGGTISVATTGCSSSSLSLPVSVQPGKPSAITGPACIVPGNTSPVTYSVLPVPGATSYVWMNTATGWTGSSTTNSITYLPSGNTVGIISVRAVSGGCMGDTVQRAVDLSQTAATGITASCIPSGITCTTTLTATGGAGTSFVWSIPAGFGSPATVTGNPVTINTTGVPGSYPVSVTTTGCNVQPSTFTRTITTGEPDTLTYITSNSPGYDILSVSLVSGCTPTAYCWRQNNTGACVGTGQSLLLQNGNPGSYTVQVSYGSCSNYLTHSSRYSSRPVNNSDGKKEGTAWADQIMIAPNPAHNGFVLSVPFAAGSTIVNVFTSKGNLLVTKKCSAVTNYFDSSKWPAGEYSIRINGQNGEYVVKKIIIAR